MKIYIYGLYNSFSDEIRYIGKTNDPKRRLSEHIIEAKSGKYSHFPKNKWILKTLNEGGEILLKTIEEVDEKNWENREIYWISEYKKKAGNLNLSRGGETSKEFFFISYEDCKKWVKENVDTSKINSSSTWRKAAKEGQFPFFIPHNPWSCYRIDGFSWYDFFGKTGNKYAKLKGNYLTFDELFNFVKNNNVHNISELEKIVKEKNLTNIPRDVKRYYLRRGKNISDLFKKFFTYDEFVEYVKNNFPGITSRNEYQKEHKNMCENAPYYFEEVYGKQVNLTDLFSNKFLSFEECKKEVIKREIKSSKEYHNLSANKENKFPRHPEMFYRNKGWTTWEDFLDVRLKHSRKNCTFDVFCRYMKLYHPNVKKSTHYIEMMKNENVSKRIPYRPDVKYKCQWKDIFEKIKNL